MVACRGALLVYRAVLLTLLTCCLIASCYVGIGRLLAFSEDQMLAPLTSDASWVLVLVPVVLFVLAMRQRGPAGAHGTDGR